MPGTTFSVTRRNRLDAANNDDANEDGHDQPEEPALAFEEGNNAGDLHKGLVGLEHVAAAQRSADTTDRKEDRQELAERSLAVFRQTFGQVVHRPARHGAVRIFIAVAHTEYAFGELGGHAQKPGQYHPESGTRTAEIDGDADTGDIAEANSTRQRRGEGLKRRDLTGVLGIEIVSADQLDGVLEAAKLDKPEIQGEDNGRDDQPAHNQWEIGAEERNRIEDGIHDRIDDRRDRVADRLIDVALGICNAGHQGQAEAGPDNSF